MAALSVEHVRVTFDDTVVLDDVAVEVGSGEIVALVGPSGSGKSTLLKVIAGILTPDAGRVLIGGVDVTATPTHRRQVGMVFQDNQLFPHRSVIDNVAFGLQMAGLTPDVRRARAEEWLARVGLPGFGTRATTSLSGGEAKRVALARTLIVEPLVVLLDEPLTGLDRALHDRLAADLATLLRDAGTTAILVTHDLAEAEAVTDRTVALPTRQSSVAGTSGPVREVGADATHDLRRRVLRAGTPTTEVAFDGDDDPTTTHLAVVADGEVVAISSWMRRPMPGSDAAAVQLRGMATDPLRHGQGLGAVLLAAGVERARRDGVELVWARARSTAVEFYLGNGFTVVGDEFLDDTTGLWHRLVVFPLPSGDSGHPR